MELKSRVVDSIFYDHHAHIVLPDGRIFVYTDFGQAMIINFESAEVISLKSPGL
jgi:hypothetical protein